MLTHWGAVPSATDRITVHGTANRIFGDNIAVDLGTDFGGDDEIDIYGTINQNVIGDGLFPNTNQIDIGGADVITVHQGGVVKDSIYGDYLNSANDNSAGHADTILIAGKVEDHIYGDYMAAGSGGADTIIVKWGGVVGQSGVNTNVYGDFRSSSIHETTGGNDHFIINGHLHGSIYGDYVRDRGGADDIIIGSLGSLTTTSSVIMRYRMMPIMGLITS